MNFLRWGISLAEMRNEHWPTTSQDSFVPEETWYRAVRVDAPVEIAFRWICQLRVAPYSYDWIDNLGKESPRHLIEGLDQLKIGQRVMSIFQVHDFFINSYLTVVPWPPRRLLSSGLRITYLCAPITKSRTTLMVRVQIAYPKHLFRSVVRCLLPTGDLLMMRKQL